ncbi:DUF4249 domain-containing protein [Chitinophagaceae bacterium LB-8]|uniref:DUF4249 domain-containing protein n=1 Tax=Paraflavisolibacter caeni TaxID=2982496 RepID=A0A9X2XXP2_9BACT|nr:DUF4249 domain-containing protein [Paraflavisolibacter caeni]MCU7551464.1 DUF4249 domain-containing protein [Paraflavisolibacter caeni]
MMYVKYFILLFILFALLSCEKSITFDLDEPEPKIVVEATIENGVAPRVVLTRSIDYFSSISPEVLASSFIHGASISVSNGTKTHQLKEYSMPLDSGYVFYYYSIDSSNLQTAFVGTLKTKYSLHITHEGKVFDATTTIPDITKKIDSVYWVPAPPSADSNKVVVRVKATDPQGFGDYIRYFTKRNSEPFLPPYNSVFDDYVIDGTTYELPLEPGTDRNEKREEDEAAFFNRGDTVTLKICNIDKPTYEFWRTMEYSYASIGNPFASPVKVTSNISNGALGYFGGYAAQYFRLTIPK